MICCCASGSIELQGRKTTACSPMRSISVVVSDLSNSLHSKGFLSKSSTAENTEDTEKSHGKANTDHDKDTLVTSKITLDVVSLRSRPSEPALPTVNERRFVACESFVHRWQRRLPPLRGAASSSLASSANSASSLCVLCVPYVTRQLSMTCGADCAQAIAIHPTRRRALR